MSGPGGGPHSQPHSQGGLSTGITEYTLGLICQLTHSKLDATLISEDRIYYYP